MGIVWRARDERLERVVAVKQLLAQPGLTSEQRQEARRRALREARIAARLHHANAIVVFDVAEHEGDPCLVMEYMESHSLAAVLADRGSLPPEEVAGIGSQVASALAAAHRSGIVHRDVKPGNILINNSGIAKITDFGIARATGDVTVTQSGVFAGTPAYLAPEVARGQDPTPASDVFSFGATLYDAVEGGPPFPERQNQLALLRLVAEGKVEPPRQAGILTALLMKLLRDDPDARPTMAQASAMLAELTGAKPSAARGPAFLPGNTKIDLARPEPIAATVAAPPQPVAAPVAAPPAPIPVGTVVAPSPMPPAPARKPMNAGNRRNLIAALLVVAVLAVAGIILVVTLNSNNGGGSGGQAGGGGGTTSSHTTAPTTSPTTSSEPVTGTQPVVANHDAGQALVNFFAAATTNNNPQAAWDMLTPGAQQYYGSEQAFASYWAPYASMGYHQANVVANSDGSANVSINLDINGSVRPVVVREILLQNGTYMFDGNTKVAS